MADVKNPVTHPLRQKFTDEEWKVYNTWVTKKSSTVGDVYWKCEVKELTGTWGEIIVSRRTGLSGTISTISNLVKTGKNIGRSNETTPVQQACRETGSRYRKKLKAGYHIIGQVNRQILQPMLAKLWSEHGSNKLIDQGDWVWQPKLDGHRALAYIVPSKLGGRATLEFFSRGGNAISVPHLEDVVFEYDTFMRIIGLDDEVHTVLLDGELYSHGTKLQDITRLVKAGVPSKLDFVIYDACILSSIHNLHNDVTADMYEARYFIVREALKYMQYKPKVSTLEHFSNRAIPKVGKHLEIWSVPITSEEAGWAATDKAITLGFEGGMMKSNLGVYKAGGRSVALLKMKRFIDEEFKIVDVTRGVDYKANGKRAMPQALFQLQIVSKDSVGYPSPLGTFEVAAPGAKSEKAEYWRTKKKWIGQLCTVKHSGYTKAGIPVHAVAMRIREDI